MTTTEELDKRVKALEAAQTAGGNQEVLIFLLTEISAAMRARSEPEYVYTAGALAGSGAVAWGVAALQPDKFFGRDIYLRPAGVAAIGLVVVALAVVGKIWREHRKFADLKKSQYSLGKLLEQYAGTGVIPDKMFSQAAGKGYLWSIGVVVAAALASIAFCISVIGPIS